MGKDLQIVEVANVRGYHDERGNVFLNAEDVARGLGFVMVRKERVTTSGDNYEAVRWNRVNEYLTGYGYPPVKAGDYIPENLFYLLAMKASNEAAKTFQLKVANEILPSIRKTGTYIDFSRVDPRFLRKVADEIEERDKKIEALTDEVVQLKPKADYCEQVLISDEKLTSELIAKEYGKHAQWLHETLGKLGVTYKRGRHIYLKAAYADKGYRVSDTVTLAGGKTVVNHYWTQKGREFVYQLLKNHRIVPVREREEFMASLF